MPVIAIANPKGGVGKSTLATNLAGALARQGHAVMLGDLDRQQSSRLWLQWRAATLPTILSWDITEDHIARPPKGTTHIVLDTPAGLTGKRLDAVMKIAGTSITGGVRETSNNATGNRMVFVGIRKPEDRANLIAYLKRETGAK